MMVRSIDRCHDTLHVGQVVCVAIPRQSMYLRRYVSISGNKLMTYVRILQTLWLAARSLLGFTVVFSFFLR